MEEKDRRCLAALGYHELSLGIRRGFAGPWDGVLPLSDRSEEELEERIGRFWSLLLQESGEKETGGLRLLPKRLGLSLREVRILIWTVLPWLDGDLRDLTETVCGGSSFWNGTLAQRLLGTLPVLGEENEFPEKDGRLEQLFFPGFSSGKPLIPDPGVLAFFLGGNGSPRWWGEAFQDSGPELGEENLVLSECQQRLVQRLAESLKDGGSSLIMQGPAGSGKTFFLRMAAGWCGREQTLFCVETEKMESFAFYVEIPAPDRAERLEIWKWMARELPLENREVLEELADRFELLPGQIRDVLELADRERRFAGKQAANREILFSCCHRRLKRHLEKRARRIPPRFSWEDLLLEERQKEKLLAAERQIRYRYQVFETWGLSEKQPYGNGVSLVFSGRARYGENHGGPGNCRRSRPGALPDRYFPAGQQVYRRDGKAYLRAF